ncbi:MULTISPECIES: LysE family translocator [Thalassospira]|jgi:threonine/homoserine/homoserine lactone efflux protein|uniref:LysE family translocator n=1 Tax=Thalassospira TaxID=168934 RepID=UPI0008277B42|nr:MULTISPECIES: LysE family translocator [Thalassospira]MBL4843356.1 LysE family translocator [Thalassospira sp.]MCD1596527.1 LysE family translocator [Thalassospira xiamenensis]OCK09363.1 Lysine exporter protein (LYSE/YGGA) [Thalassospira sp. KO164]PXX32136.1 threonine/homoserine/homoserine lactone efflux protein [Thalassospira sp. 11-3]SEE71881.1 Threonine/homoserine/homoserine lactone efflux protein [Thalassospira permensis]|tara:strand:+ start:10788 stop:11402 length:615 start_codon:yes stop_codon:yes gene_type:complete
MISPDYLLTSLIVVLLPGTGVIYTLAIGLGRGMRASIFAAFGCTLGILPAMGASILGLAALLHTSALAFEILRYLGVAWLLYMAWGMWRGTGAMKVTAKSDPVNATKIIRDGILLNALNPKLSLFFLAFLPQFITTNATGTTAQMTLLGLIFMAITFAVFILYGFFASTLRRHVIERPRIMNWLGKSFAGVFVLLGAKLALSAK